MGQIIYVTAAITIFLGLVFISIGITPAHAQTNQTMPAGNNVSSSESGSNTFSAGGSISSLLIDKQPAQGEQPKIPYLLSGMWNLEVNNGNVTEFLANFTMVHTDGTESHTHSISNFRIQDDSRTNLKLEKNGTTTISGISDITTNNTIKWTDVQTTIAIEKLNTTSFTFDSNSTDNHFKGQPIYGVVINFSSETGDAEMRQKGDIVTAGKQAAQPGQNATEPSLSMENRTGGGNESITNNTDSALPDIGSVIENILNNTG